MIEAPAPTWLEVDCAAIAHNVRTMMLRTNRPLMAVVKANGYGLGAVEVSRTMLNAGATWLAVARVSEGLALRTAGIQAPILVMTSPVPAEVDLALLADLTLTLHAFEQIPLLAAHSVATSRTVRVHLKIDTGFGRLGVLNEHAVGLAQQALAAGIIVEGIYSQLAMADEVPGHPLTTAQIGRFRRALSDLREAGIMPRWVHLSNSAVAWGVPDGRFNLVRAGSALLGLKPFYFEPFPSELRRVFTWKSTLISCKRLPAGWGVGYGQTYQPKPGEWIGVVAVGYGDGFRRAEGNQVLINGQRVDVVGRICSDACMVSLPEPLPLGTEVVVMGEQNGAAIYHEELAARWTTSQSDVIGSINARVPRIYVGG